MSVGVCVIWRGEGRVKEGEPLIAGEGGRGENERTQVQHNVATQTTEEPSTGFQTHLYTTTTQKSVLIEAYNIYIERWL